MKSFKKVNVKILKPKVTMHGYLFIVLHKGNKCKQFFIHRLVAEAFLPNPDGKLEVDHIYGMRFDNCADNLRWLSLKDNYRAYYEGVK